MVFMMYHQSTAPNDDKVAFSLKISLIFHLNNIPEEGLEMILAITCPNILPYAREAVSDMVTKRFQRF